MARPQKKGGQKPLTKKKQGLKRTEQDEFVSKVISRDVFEAVDEPTRRKANDLDEVDNLEYDAGEIAEEDDEEIDSDEAFDESDEERFEGYKFSGSTKSSEKKHLKKKAPIAPGEIDLNENSDEDSEEEESDEDGEGYMDLSQMLTADNDEEEEEFRGFDDIEDDEDDESDDDNMDLDDQVANLIDSIESKKRRRVGEEEGSSTKKRQIKERNEAYKEGEFNLPVRDDDDASKKLSLQDLMGTVDDEATFGSLKTSLETLAGKGKNLSRRALDAPLPKRVQDRMERTAAAAAANEEITKWQPTVKMNREAEHLQFPLHNNDDAPKETKTSAAMVSKFKAETTLEQQISKALADAGMKDEELEEFEALKLNKLTVEEVEAKRKELRMMRELMFRHEIKNKRLKKIKSKSYRKLQRKEKDKLTSQINDMAEIDHEMEDTDKMDAAMSRAEERMSLKHKNTSKWAKRALARGTQDEGTRDAIMEQLRRGEELRRRIDGDQSEDSDEAEDDETYVNNQLTKLNDEIAEDTQPKKGLLAMKFMQDAAQRQLDTTKNDVAEFEKEWLGADSDDDVEEKDENYSVIANNPGRMAFGAKAKQPKKPKATEENEEISNSEVDTTEDVELDLTKVMTVKTKETKKQQPKKTTTTATTTTTKSKSNIAKSKLAKGESDSESDDGSDNEDDQMVHSDKVSFSQRELVARAFANDDVVAEFEDEKMAEIKEDGDQVEDLTLPGWGAWAGAGVKKNKKKKKILKVTKGIDADQRKDANLSHVIINEKINKKAEKYRVTSVPFPFKTMEQYERSISQPVGNEWNTRQTFMKMTKPRIITKLGKVIDPLKAPFA
ncbi:small-subunit processome [Helicostylum pulchrum]|nr:small-subunit processome [Helicostylum pulchrum]